MAHSATEPACGVKNEPEHQADDMRTDVLWKLNMRTEHADGWTDVIPMLRRFVEAMGD
jgi:hypothetical protein